MKENIPCSPEMIGQCRVFKKQGVCYQDTHHTYWPEPEYKTDVEKEFRALEINQKFICRALHNAKHREEPPEKPSRSLMSEVIENEKQKRSKNKA